MDKIVLKAIRYFARLNAIGEMDVLCVYLCACVTIPVAGKQGGGGWVIYLSIRIFRSMDFIDEIVFFVRNGE